MALIPEEERTDWEANSKWAHEWQEGKEAPPQPLYASSDDDWGAV